MDPSPHEVPGGLSNAGQPTRPPTVKRVLNNNAVMVVDDHDEVSIVLGKAIGYGVRPGSPVAVELISETFLPDAATPVEQLAALLADTPIQIVRVAREIADTACASMPDLQVTQSLLLPLADHIASAIDRAKEGIEFDYPLRWEVNQLYPSEVAVGRAGVEMVRRRLGVEIPAEEAIPLAMHIVNAQFSARGMDRTVQMTQRIAEVLATVEATLGIQIDRNAMSAARFITHLRYLFVRLDGHQQGEPAPRAVLDAVADAHADAYRCAQAVRCVLESDGDVLTEDEILYLTLHIARLAAEVSPSD